MKLYLSSQGLGSKVGDLERLVGDNKKTAVVANAVDHYDRHTRETRVRKEKQALREAGFQPEELDLREYFDDPDNLRDRLAIYGLLWIRGGNVYNLRRAMIRSGFDEAALDRIKEGNLVYGGYSAATVVAGPDLFGSEIVDDPQEVPSGYPVDDPPYSALGLTEYYIAPHYLTVMPWRQTVSDYITYLSLHNRDVLRLQDGDVHIVAKASGVVALNAFVQLRERDSCERT